MSKEKPKASPSIPPDLPKALIEKIQQAAENVTPSPSEREAFACPLLHEMLAPRIVPDQRYKDNPKPPKVLREPLLMVSWDRVARAWKWAISDRQLNFGVTGHVAELDTLITEVEGQLAQGKVAVKSLKVT